MYNIHLLPASFGDSILIEYGEAETHYILIDGGPYFAFKNILPAIGKVAPDLETIELLVVTHIDIDHIDGIVNLLNGSELPFRIKEIWFNGWEQLIKVKKQDDLLGPVQGEYLSFLIDQKKLPQNTFFNRDAVVINDYSSLPVISLTGGMELKLFSPGRQALKNLVPVWEKVVREKIGDLSTIKARLEADRRYDDLLGEDDLTIEEMQALEVVGDTSEANESSIAFIAKYEGRQCLFSGDATSDVLLEAINSIDEIGRITLDAWKIAHHGSKKSTLDRLMERIKCKRILISSDGKHYEHPDQVCIAKLLKNNGPGLELNFNYYTAFNKMWDNKALKLQYDYQTIYGEEGLLTVRL